MNFPTLGKCLMLSFKEPAGVGATWIKKSACLGIPAYLSKLCKKFSSTRTTMLWIAWLVRVIRLKVCRFYNNIQMGQHPTVSVQVLLKWIAGSRRMNLLKASLSKMQSKVRIEVWEWILAEVMSQCLRFGRIRHAQYPSSISNRRSNMGKRVGWQSADD